jgi:hypothetical protein
LRILLHALDALAFGMPGAAALAVQP